MDGSKPGIVGASDTRQWSELGWAALSWLLLTAGIAGGMVCAIEAAGSMNWIALPMLVGIWIGTVLVHEYGHVLGARAAGMVPWIMQVGVLQCHALKRGWRIRIRRGTRPLAGYVMAFVDPERPPSRQISAMAASGPAANLMVVASAVVAFVVLEDGRVRAIVAAVGIVNLAVGLANLLPRKTPCESDGAMLLRALKAPDTLEYSIVDRLNGMSVRGVTADRLPKELLDSLAQAAPPMPLIALWFALKARQNMCDWDAAAALASLVESAVEETPAEVRSAFHELIASLRCEVGFSVEMVDTGTANDADPDIHPELDWHMPWLRPRWQALRAARRGDPVLAHRLLKASAKHAERSVDRSLRICERRIRAQIAAALDHRTPMPARG